MQTVADYMVNGTVNALTNTVDLVYKVTGPAGVAVTFYVSPGYYVYTTASLGTAAGSSITVLSQAYGGYEISKTYTSSGTDGSRSGYTREPDLSVTFTMPTSGVYYFVVPGSVQSEVSVSSGAIGSGSTLNLGSTVETGYGVVPYSVSD